MDYIKEIKLTLATHDILKSDEKIINIALKYDDPGSFTKVFKKFLGVILSQAAIFDITLSATPLKFTIKVKGEKLC